MIRWFLHIVCIACLSYSSYAQILAPMGQGLPAAPDKIASYNNNIIAAYENRNEVIELQIWNGDFWYSIATPQLPKASVTSMGEYKILDLQSSGDNVYLATGYNEKMNPSGENHISMWNGTSWKNISTDIILSSLSIDKLYIDNGVLTCVGKFSKNNKNYNLIKYENGTWLPKGNLITSNVQNDKINSVVAHNGTVYATGRFTSPIANNISLAVWDGHSWSAAKHPPFLGKNIALGSYNENVVVYGESDFNSESISIKNGDIWQNMSQGLENYEIETITQFADLEGSLYAIGNFKRKDNNAQTNLMAFDGKQWNETNFNLSNIEQLYSWNNIILLSGDFSDNAQLNGIGKVYNDRAQINLRVYNDLNSNCIKEPNEQWLDNYPIKLSTSNTRPQTGAQGQLYLQTKKQKIVVNADKHNYYTPTCPDAAVDISEYRTYYGLILGAKQEPGIYDASIHLSDDQGNKANLGDIKTAHVCIKNKGSQPITDAKVVLNFGESINNLTSNLNYDSYINNVATWTVNVSSNSTYCFPIHYSITGENKPTIVADINLRDFETDNNPSDNKTVLWYAEGGTIENAKHCLNGKTIDEQASLVQYKIGFRNTSAKTVTSVRVVDELDPNLIISYKGIDVITAHKELEPYSYVEYQQQASGDYQSKLITTFKNLNLVPFSVDETKAVGFVDYALHIVPGLIDKGTNVCNTAKIYFGYDDGTYDEAIVTNTVCSIIGETLGVTNGAPLPRAIEALTIGPNPVHDFIHLKNSGTDIYNVKIINALGQEVVTEQIKPYQERKIDISTLAHGVYTIYANGIFAQKMVLN